MFLARDKAMIDPFTFTRNILFIVFFQHLLHQFQWVSDIHHEIPAHNIEPINIFFIVFLCNFIV